MTPSQTKPRARVGTTSRDKASNDLSGARVCRDDRRACGPALTRQTFTQRPQQPAAAPARRRGRLLRRSRRPRSKRSRVWAIWKSPPMTFAPISRASCPRDQGAIARDPATLSRTVRLLLTNHLVLRKAQAGGLGASAGHHSSPGKGQGSGHRRVVSDRDGGGSPTACGFLTLSSRPSMKQVCRPWSPPGNFQVAPDFHLAVAGGR